MRVKLAKLAKLAAMEIAVIMIYAMDTLLYTTYICYTVT